MTGFFSWCYFKRISFLHCINCSNGYMIHLFSVLFRVSGGYQIDRLREQMGVITAKLQISLHFLASGAARWSQRSWGGKCAQAGSLGTGWKMSLFWKREFLGLTGFSRNPQLHLHVLFYKRLLKILAALNVLLFPFHFSKSSQSFLKPGFYFTSSMKIFLSTPIHGNCIFYQTPLAQEKKIH